MLFCLCVQVTWRNVKRVMTNQDREVLENTRSRVTINTNSQMLSNNPELSGIVVNKGQIHMELA